MKRLVRRQTVQHLPLVSSDEYSGNTYGGPVHVPARWSDRVEVIQTGSGTELVANAHVLTEALVKEGDLLTDTRGRDREVVMVREARDTRGRLRFRIALVR